MRGSYWRLVALVSSVALIALMVVAGVAGAANRGAKTHTRLSTAGTPPRGTPVGPAPPSGQRRYNPSPTTNPWVPLAHQPPISPGTMLLTQDGTVLVHQDNTGTWYKLTPNSKGGYSTGTWTQIATMPSGYQPEYFASQILSDGRMLIEGGEYNGSGTEVWTNKGAIYNPVTNKWSVVNPPTGWVNIGDAQSTLLANGRFMMGHPFDDGTTSGTADALLNPGSLTWATQPGTGKADRNDEEGYQLLPNGNVLTVNDEQALNNPGSPGSQFYNPSTGAWSNQGTLPVLLPHSPDEELGPMVLRPNGSVFAVGATGATAVFGGGAWSAGPSLPNNIDGNGQYDSADGPGSIMPNGNVLVPASPGIFQTPTHFWVYNGSTLAQVPDPTNAPNDSTYYTRLLPLPTGQILFDDGSDMELYTAGGSAISSWTPKITSLSSTSLARSSSYTLQGTQLAGRSTGAGYGDDAQNNTNFPLVRITNNATGVVTYARTTGETSHSVAANVASSMTFQVKSTTPTGASTLRVVTNGIASPVQAVTIT